MNRLLAGTTSVDLKNTFFNYHTNAGVTANDTGSFLSNLLPNIIILTGVVALFYTVRNGFNLITSAGKGLSPADISKARSALIYSFFGLLLVAAAYFILQIVSTVTGINFMDLSAIS